MMEIAKQEYLKQSYLYTSSKEGKIHTKDLAAKMSTKPASVTSTIKKLAAKDFYSKYNGSCYQTIK